MYYNSEDFVVSFLDSGPCVEMEKLVLESTTEFPAGLSDPGILYPYNADCKWEIQTPVDTVRLRLLLITM